MCKLENLFKNSGEGHLQLGNILIQWGQVGQINGRDYTLVYPIPFKAPPKITISQWDTNDGSVLTHAGRTERNCPFHTTGNKIAFDWIAIGIV